MAESTQKEELAKPYKLIQPLHFRGKLIDPKVTKDATVHLYDDQAESLKKQGVIA